MANHSLSLRIVMTTVASGLLCSGCALLFPNQGRSPQAEAGQECRQQVQDWSRLVLKPGDREALVTSLARVKNEMKGPITTWGDSLSENTATVSFSLDCSASVTDDLWGMKNSASVRVCGQFALTINQPLSLRETLCQRGIDEQLEKRGFRIDQSIVVLSLRESD